MEKLDIWQHCSLVAATTQSQLTSSEIPKPKAHGGSAIGNGDITASAVRVVRGIGTADVGQLGVA